MLSNWAFEIVGFVGKNKKEAGEAIEKIVKKNPVGLNIGFFGFYVKKPDRTEPKPVDLNRFRFGSGSNFSFF